MIVNSILEPILASPNLESLLQELQDLWQDEMRRREEFHAALTPSMKAEFINGEIVVQSPALRRHIYVSDRMNQILRTYTTKNKSGVICTEKALVRLPRNSYEPDLLFFNNEVAEITTPDTHYFPPPQWVCETISKSTEKNDRGIKFTDYALNGINEYWIIDPVSETVEVYILPNGKTVYELVGIYSDGIITSQVMGIELPVRAIFDDDVANEMLLKILSI